VTVAKSSTTKVTPLLAVKTAIDSRMLVTVVTSFSGHSRSNTIDKTINTDLKSSIANAATIVNVKME
jgi:hypothetical protein